MKRGAHALRWDLAPTWTPEWSRLVERLIADVAVSHNYESYREAARTMGVLPVAMDMGGVWALTTSGRIVSYLHDEPDSLNEVRDPLDRTYALVRASHRYTDLSSLKPDRPGNAIECDTCRGSGKFRIEDHFPDEEGAETCPDLDCGRCGAIGWTLPETVREEQLAVRLPAPPRCRRRRRW